MRGHNSPSGYDLESPSASTRTGDAASVTLDADGRIATWSETAESLTGRADDVVGDPLSALFVGGADELQDALETARQSGHFEEVLQCTGTSGETFPASVTLTPRGTEQRGYTVVIRDETGARQVERERNLLAQAFETSPAGLLITDADGTVERANRRTREIVGCPPESLVGRPLGETGEYLDATGEPVPDDALPVKRALDTGETVGSEELQLAGDDGDGEPTWVTVSAAPTGGDSGVGGVTVTIEEITGRVTREQPLRCFCEAVEQAGHSIYVADTDGTIQYVNPRFEEMTGYSAEEAIGETPTLLNSGEHDQAFFTDLWETILDGEVWTGEVTNRRKSGDRYVVNQTIVPIQDETGTVERFVAVNDEITERNRRERTLRRQRNSLERIQQILGSLRPINRELARVGTRAEVDRIVCNELAASDAYLFAWVGDYNQATEEVDAREWAGVEEQFVRDLDPSVSEGHLDRGPFAQAAIDREVAVRQEIPTDPGAGARRGRAIEYGFQSVAAVPVTHGGTVLGVIGVYSARPTAFDRYERELLRELGERIGHAVNAAENKQLLHTDTVVEVEFEVGTGDSAFGSVTADLGCRLSVSNVTPTADMEYLCYLEVDGERPAAVVESLQARSRVERARAVRARGETGIVEATVRAGPMATLLEHGATVRSYEAAEGAATLLAETTPQSDVQALITDLQATHEGTAFVAKRTHTQQITTVTMTKRAVEDALTDRQREVLALAYHAGFFESPRHSTGEELATALGVAAPTFYRHVRKGLSKVLGLLANADDLYPSPDHDGTTTGLKSD